MQRSSAHFTVEEDCFAWKTMVGPTYDCLGNPLGAVRLTFEKALCADSTALDGKDWGAGQLFRQLLYEESLISKVPIVTEMNIAMIPLKTLVRFRGMIQDMLENEIYVGAYKNGDVWTTTKYTGVPQHIDDSAADMRLWERRRLHVVSIPGINSWANDISEVAIERYLDLVSSQREKRARVDAESDSHEASCGDSEMLPSSKKMKEDDKTSLISRISTITNSGTACPSLSVNADASRDSFSCLVKVYDSPEPDLKINEVYEFVGVLSFDPTMAPIDSDDFDAMSVDLPDIKALSLHCIVHKKLNMIDLLPSSPFSEPKVNVIRDIRESLLKHLTSILGNDELAAHFLLLHLLSSIHARADNVVVGKLAMNLINFDKESSSVFCSALEATLNSLLPVSKRIVLNSDYLNTASLFPKKDYQVGRLLQGALQLVEGSHVLFDETGLDPDKLNHVGIENARSLNYLVENQKAAYDFTYYKIEMAAEYQILIVSEKKSTVCAADVVVPFRPSGGMSPSVLSTEEALTCWRWYLASMKSMPHTIAENVKEVVEKDLVAARQADRSFHCEELSRLLTMGRLISASFGETRLTLQHWELVKNLESLRRERIV